MNNYLSSLEKKDYFLLISLSAFLIPLLLFVFRYQDDNRLTSWMWAFAGVDTSNFFLILIPGIIAAYALSKFSLPEQNPVIFLFIASFIAGFLFWKEPEVIVDASRYFTQAKHLKEYGIRYFAGEWGRGVGAWTDLPLVPFLYGLIFKFFGESRLCIQIFTTSIFSLTVVLTFLTGKILWDEDVGFRAGALLSGMPYLLTQVPLMLVDVPTMFFLTLSIFTFIKALERGRVWIAISSIAVFLAVFSKYSTWLMLSVLVVIFLVYLREGAGGRNIIYRGTLVAIVAGILIGIVIFIKFDVISEQINLLLSYQRPGLRRWGESFVSTFFYQVHPFITIAALYSFYAAVKKRDFRYVIIIWLILLVVLLGIRRARYILIIFPMLALAASYGLREIKDKEIKRFIVLCAVISSLLTGFFVYLPFLQKMSASNLKDAGRFLNSLDASKIEVLTMPSKNYIVNPDVSVPILDFFTDKDIYYYNVTLPPPFEKIKESPLRFTWDFKKPAYYSPDMKGSNENKVVVVISSESGQVMTGNIQQKIKGLYLSETFDTTVGIFKYTTLVKIYLHRHNIR